MEESSDTGAMSTQQVVGMGEGEGEDVPPSFAPTVPPSFAPTVKLTLSILHVHGPRSVIYVSVDKTANTLSRANTTLKRALVAIPIRSHQDSLSIGHVLGHGPYQSGAHGTTHFNADSRTTEVVKVYRE